MDKWLDSFSKWPAMNQLVFSCVFVIAGMIMLFLFGIWTIQLARYLAVTYRGWPKEEDPSKKVSASASDMATILALLEEVRRRPTLDGPIERKNLTGGLPKEGLDWRQEIEQQKKELEYQAELQARLSEKEKALSS